MIKETTYSIEDQKETEKALFFAITKKIILL